MGKEKLAKEGRLTVVINVDIPNNNENEKEAITEEEKEEEKEAELEDLLPLEIAADEVDCEIEMELKTLKKLKILGS